MGLHKYSTNMNIPIFKQTGLAQHDPFYTCRETIIRVFKINKIKTKKKNPKREGGVFEYIRWIWNCIFEYIGWIWNCIKLILRCNQHFSWSIGQKTKWRASQHQHHKLLKLFSLFNSHKDFSPQKKKKKSHKDKYYRLR